MGQAAYKSHIQVEHTKDMLNQFKNKTPSGSRANIKAKGQWLNNQWCIEFSRALNTGEIDDLQFNLSKKYLFGISRYEIAGRNPDPKLTQPLYGSGDISEKLELVFNP